jgi:hypothetical protein
MRVMPRGSAFPTAEDHSHTAGVPVTGQVIHLQADQGCLR